MEDFIDAKTLNEREKSTEIGHQLVDEYSELQNKKKEIEERLTTIKEKMINLAKERNVDVLHGNDIKASIKEYTKIVYPENKELLIKVIKKKGLYEELSNINYFKLSPKIVKNQIDQEIIDLIKKETSHRISLIPINR